MSNVIYQDSAASKFKQWDTFLDRATGDDEKILAVGFGEAVGALATPQFALT